jgi:2'-5' RNA ligase
MSGVHVQSFFATVPAARWRRPHGLLHLYALPGPDVAEMAQAYQQVLAARAVTGLSRQPAGHLHMTVEQLLVYADELPDDRLEQLQAALAAHVAQVPAFTLTIGPALVSVHSITLDAVPDEPWRVLRRAVRAAVTETLGPDAIPPMTGPGRPHITLGYATQQLNIEPHLGALNHVRLDRAVLRVDEIVLLAVDQDTDAGVYTWPGVLAKLPLAC